MVGQHVSAEERPRYARATKTIPRQEETWGYFQEGFGVNGVRVGELPPLDLGVAVGSEPGWRVDG